MYYTSVLGAECIALLCSVSRVATASFSKVVFNDVLVRSTLTLPGNNFTGKEEKPCNRTRDLPHTRSDVLTTEPPGL